MDATVDAIESWLGRRLPVAYREYLIDNPEDVLMENDRTLIYGCESVVERNTTFESQEYCPGYLAIGDDSGCTAFVLSLADGRIHQVDIGAMTSDSMKPVAQNFEQWSMAGFPFN